MDGIANRTGARLVAHGMRSRCAGREAGDVAGAQDRSPSGVRSVSSPSITISHSSSVGSKWYGQDALPGSSS